MNSTTNPLAPGAQRLIDMTVGSPSLADLPLEQARAAIVGMAGAFGQGDDVEVQHREVPGGSGTRPGRIYRPRISAGEAHPLPPMLFFHGGGWSTGDLDTSDALCRRLSARIGCVVLAIDYRLAPEHPFPAALDDGSAAARWLQQAAPELGAAPGPIIVAGDSAGGNLAASLAVKSVTDEIDIGLQLLLFPAVDLAGDHSSQREFGEGYFATSAELELWISHYLAGGDPRDPRASPALTESLAGAPPAVVLTAECDPTRDAAEHYASRLSRDGVPVFAHRFPGQIHDFVLFGDLMAESDPAVTLISELVLDQLRLTSHLR